MDPVDYHVDKTLITFHHNTDFTMDPKIRVIMTFRFIFHFTIDSIFNI